MGLNLRSMDDDLNSAWSGWRTAAAAPGSASNGGISVNVSVSSLGGGGGGHGGYSWEEAAFAEDSGSTWPPRSYSCNFCRKEFRSAQALGGHMNIHRRDRARLRQGISVGSASTVPQQQQQQQQQHRNGDDFSGGGGAPAPSPPDLRAVVPRLISWPHSGADQGFKIQQQQQQNQVFWQSKAANFYRGSSSNLPAACSSSASCVSPPSTVLSMSLFSNSRNPTTTSPAYQYHHHHHQYSNNWQQQQQYLHPIIQSEILVSSDSSDSSELLEPSKHRKSIDFHVGYAGSRSTEHSNLRDMAAPEDDDGEEEEDEEEEEEEELDLELRLGDSRRPPLNKIPSSNGGF